MVLVQLTKFDLICGVKILVWSIRPHSPWTRSFCFVVFITRISISITHHSKIVCPTDASIIWVDSLHSKILRISVRLVWLNFVSLFYYLAYFCYYFWVSLYFLILFMSLTVLFQLIFHFYLQYSQQKVFSFSKIIRSQTDHK